MRFVYGPIESRRLGVSLGIDPVSCTKGQRICSFYCTYCQLYGRGPVEYLTTRKNFVNPEDVSAELEKALSECNPDRITFSGTSEPTLARNLGELAALAKKKGDGIHTAILTNSSLIKYRDVMEDLFLIDEVHAKLDAPNEKIFRKINRPARGTSFSDVFRYLQEFSRVYKGTLSLDMMFMESNQDYATEMAEMAARINPYRVIVDTPTRKCPVSPLSKEKLDEITEVFTGIGLNAVSFYRLKKPESPWIDEKNTMLRRPEH